jgi:lysophospholipase L1-like esterase
MEPGIHQVTDRRSRFRRLRLLGIPLILLSAVIATGGGVTKASASTDPYYLSLGDSLSQGVQPNDQGKSVETNVGYANDLWHTEQLQIPRLQLAKLGCPGETTTSMRTGVGSLCTYTDGSQLAQALDFIAHHNVAFITIDIGANDVLPCELLLTGVVPLPPAVVTCFQTGAAKVFSNLTGQFLPSGVGILPALRAAAHTVPIYAMNYYDALLAHWVTGPTGQVIAGQSVPLATTFDGLLSNEYSAFGIPVADVSAAFQTTNFTIVPTVGLPLNVFLICSWTWGCTPPPVGPNIHPNETGYGVIAAAFANTIGTI